MSFLGFGKNKFQSLSDKLIQHEQAAKNALHQKHPHTLNLFNRYEIELRDIRRKSVKTTTAAALIGAFLAFPHLLGHGTIHEKPAEQNVQVQSIERMSDKTLKSDGGPQNTSTPGLNNANSSHQNPENNLPADEPDSKKNKSQGHLHGRSYLAPPKDHGLHDLGLHRGEDNGKGKAESPGPHPEELEVIHKGKNS